MHENCAFAVFGILDDIGNSSDCEQQCGIGWITISARTIGCDTVAHNCCFSRHQPKFSRLHTTTVLKKLRTDVLSAPVCMCCIGSNMSWRAVVVFANSITPRQPSVLSSMIRMPRIACMRVRARQSLPGHFATLLGPDR